MRLFSFYLVTCIAWNLCCGQSELPDLCDVYKFAAPSAQTFVDKILDMLSQKSGTILVFTSTDSQVARRGGAASSECPAHNGMERWIVYDPAMIPTGPELEFAMAHETAHHLNYHILNSDTSHSKEQELEADRYAARYLAILGWDENRLLAALNGLKLPKLAQKGYPSFDERRSAVIQGYEQSNLSAAAPLRANKLSSGNAAASWRSATSPPDQSDLIEARQRADAAFGRGQYYAAMPVYKQLADAGDSTAMAAIGTMYEKGGEGLPKDVRQAAMWHLKAAEAGNSAAMQTIGLDYMVGDGVPKDYAQAAHWLEKGAEAGQTMAMGAIGVLYGYGRGVPKDLNKAAFWLRKAAANGDETAKQQLQKLGISQ